MAQRQRVGFQTRRLGVQIPLGSYASRAPLAERSAVNRQVLGSIPSGGALFLLGTPSWVQGPPGRVWRFGQFSVLPRILVLCFLDPVYVLVAQLDKASDYESEDWGFKSLQGYFSLHGLMDKAHPS